jgi:hypothetical protein
MDDNNITVQDPANDLGNVDEGKTEPTKDFQPIKVGSKTFNSPEEVAKAYEDLERDYTRKTQKLSEIEKSVASSDQQSGASNAEDQVEQAINILKERGVTTRDEVDLLLNLRDFVSEKNNKAKYDDLRLSKEEERLLLERFKMGIPMEETYNALKANSMIKHVSEEQKAHAPVQVNNNQGAVSPNIEIGGLELKKEDMKISKEGYPNGKIHEAINKILDNTDPGVVIY